MKKITTIWKCLSFLLFGYACSFSAFAVEVETILPTMPVHEADQNGFADSLAWDGRNLFTGSVIPPDGEETGTNLQTLIRKGSVGANGQWRWHQSIIDRKTLDDKWHNVPSMGLDRAGHLHIGYNMHNMPWQYVVSQRPGSIDGFLFRGQAINDEQRDMVQHKVRYHFFDFGRAAIPGNQVTYPVFSNAPDGRLYLTYRYAMRPKLGWFKRSIAGGLAVYNEQSRQWQQLGGDVRITAEEADLHNGATSMITRPIVYEEGWTISPIQVAFDPKGGLHMTWLWRPEAPGREFVQPSYAFSPDGGRSFYRSNGQRYQLPIGREASEKLIVDHKRLFFPLSRTTVSPEGEPTVLLDPVHSRPIILSRKNKRWQSEPAPNYEQELHYDKQGRLWGFSSGLKVTRRDTPDGKWQHLLKGNDGLCSPRVLPAENMFFVFMRGCKASTVSILKVTP